MKVKIKTPKEILGVDLVSFEDSDGWFYSRYHLALAVAGEVLSAVREGMDYKVRVLSYSLLLKPEWCEVIEPDWKDVPVDTKILVREKNIYPWEKRHFAKFENDTVYAWENGKTSFTTVDTMCWPYAKLAE